MNFEIVIRQSSIENYFGYVKNIPAITTQASTIDDVRTKLHIYLRKYLEDNLNNINLIRVDEDI